MHRKICLYLPAPVYYPLNLVTLGASVFLVSSPYTFIPMFCLSFVPHKEKTCEMLLEKMEKCKSSICIVRSDKCNKRMDPYRDHTFIENNNDPTPTYHKSYPLECRDVAMYLIMNFIIINKIYVRLLMLWCLLLVYIEIISDVNCHEIVQNYLHKTIAPATYNLIPFELPIKA